MGPSGPTPMRMRTSAQTRPRRLISSAPHDCWKSHRTKSDLKRPCLALKRRQKKEICIDKNVPSFLNWIQMETGHKLSHWINDKKALI
ncbi:hypothetical protein TNIN_406641 [Trichonephila inaurata madagascariensis]|uniref:Uncharacterized protein n=1 Tax=Trichonephila inaurata madagascariensis TaxID=2747483 RepID=A0A8X7C3Q3_9ARAC|nr:hypothetical protein TNIN_406641 [Trichonephila inaurata madagascariensis]